MDSRGKRYLEQLIETKLRAIGAGADANASIVAQYELYKVRGAVEALVAVGELDGVTGESILSDLDGTFRDHGFIRDVHVHLEARGKPVASASSASSVRPERWSRVLTQPTTPEFVRTVPLEGELVGLFPQRRARLMSVDLWSDRFELRYVLVPPRGREEFMRRRPGERLQIAWEATDGTGLVYRGLGTSQAPSAETVRFQPAAAADAQSLLIVARGADGQDLSSVTIQLS